MPDHSNQTVELFSGLQIFSSLAQALGYDTFAVDRNAQTGPGLATDVRTLQASSLPQAPLVVWAAPPDAAFCSAAEWDELGYPQSPAGEEAQALLSATTRLIGELKAQWWFIENPYGPLRHFAAMSGFNRGYPSRNRVTINHADYGHGPDFLTDVWTNAFWWQPRFEAVSRLARRPAQTPVQAVPPEGRRLPAAQSRRCSPS